MENSDRHTKSLVPEPVINSGCFEYQTNAMAMYYEGRSKSSRKSASISFFCKPAELNSFNYIDKHILYLYSKFCCSGMNTTVTMVAMETVVHDHRPTFVQFYKKSMFNDDVAFDS